MAKRRHAEVPDEDTVIDEVNAAIAAMDGEETSITMGDPSNIDEDDGGERYEVEVTATMFNLKGQGAMGQAFDYSTIEWGGWVSAHYYDGEIQITASGVLAFDGIWQNEETKIGGEYDVITGEYDIPTRTWTWYSDTM